MKKRHVEVFTAGCPVCAPAVQLVKETACPDCEVVVHDLHESGQEKGAQYGIHGRVASRRVPIERSCSRQASAGDSDQTVHFDLRAAKDGARRID